ncbi:glutamine-hydrolyzing GMP synthase [Desulfofalx alkaliphila]|uniref:glutamine-hydrolyzing GMP synthase n=1 Tax=Desulfofalx alkaliphila TaxID=105483 RepID=UPI0004E0C641|nr:glutamine-hydrolyzing GMP synthase [Desulfofalx alkaliphila]
MSLGQEMVVVLDFGGKYTQMIARRIRECKVFCEILPYNIGVDKLRNKNPKGIVFSGGPADGGAENAPPVDDAIYRLEIPILAVGYGMQMMARQLGGKISGDVQLAEGKKTLEITANSRLLAGLETKEECWVSQGHSVEELPQGFAPVARSEDNRALAMEDPDKKLYAMQFHPEVAHTPKGKQVLQNFLYDICRCSDAWTMSSFLRQSVAEVQAKAGDKKVLCALSGGVDSSVAAVLVHRAVGDNLTCVFVDNGLLRKGEAEQVINTFREKFNMNLIHVDARERFLNKLAGVTDPERKRKIIGEEFIRLFEEEAKKLGQIDYLVQGTVYPDVVESGTAAAGVIKSHHNVGGLPEDMQFDLIEPLRWLFKDEVRLLGEELGLPEEVVWRQPFPGPGLAVRCLGEVTEEKLAVLREADAIVTDEIKKAGLDREIWQYFAVLPNIKSVGVKGDRRTYVWTVGVRAIHSSDGMTAQWAHIPYQVLDSISTRICKEIEQVNRVVYDITAKPPSTIEWE